MSEDYLIRYCAPTLAGIKTANLFTCPYDSKDALTDSIRRINRRLTQKGLRLLPLRLSGSRALIYLYRPRRLSADLSNAAAERLLHSFGYTPGNCERCVGELARKLRREKEFPHEIGLFLGYPPEDVLGFMKLGPAHCKYTGCWKVYGNEEAAKKTFAQYKRCTRIYCDLWARGRDIDFLTVAGR